MSEKNVQVCDDAADLLQRNYVKFYFLSDVY